MNYEVPRPFLIVPQTVCGKLQVGVWYKEIPSYDSAEWWTTSSAEAALEHATELAATVGPVYVMESCAAGFWIIAKAVM